MPPIIDKLQHNCRGIKRKLKNFLRYEIFVELPPHVFSGAIDGLSHKCRHSVGIQNLGQHPATVISFPSARSFFM
jgi:hypothetical protein